MRILVLGGDGFCGWPTSLALSHAGHDITIADNLSRRRIDRELGVQSLTPIASIEERLEAWQEVTGRGISFLQLDVAREYDRLLSLIEDENPDVIIHFAEQRAAPYSMKSSWHKRYTVDNNLNATHNLCAAVVEAGSQAHIVHLGTMGVYGYGTAGSRIPEGYLRVRHGSSDNPVEEEILHPVNPGSIYHLTKTQDQLFFAYYNKNDGVRVTDLHQGIVWGTQTAQTKLDKRLVNRFDYDGDYGTVLNRFIMQAAVGVPLTVHGTGGQTRGFIHLQDSCRCIELAIANPPSSGDRVQIFNQVTETARVRDLAEKVSALTGAEIAYVDNPRNEAPENDLEVSNEQFLGLGLKPMKLEDGLIEEIYDVAKAYSDRCDRSKIACRSRWNAGR